MEHSRIYNAAEVKTNHGKIIVEGPITAKQLKDYQFHKDLVAFRTAEDQHRALVGIANLPEGRIIIARHRQTVVGYVTFLYPDPLERWSEGQIENLIELGAIEVIPAFRNNKLGKKLLQVSMMDDFMENYIIITTEYYWHWDLKGSGLSVWDYRKVMEKMMTAGGLETSATDDPEITSHPANCLMVRIGKNIDYTDVQRFDRLRFKSKFMY